MPLGPREELLTSPWPREELGTFAMVNVTVFPGRLEFSLPGASAALDVLSLPPLLFFRVQPTPSCTPLVP